jgi:hypothetical protein
MILNVLVLDDAEGASEVLEKHLEEMSDFLVERDKTATLVISSWVLKYENTIILRKFVNKMKS